jgi:leucyl/phenylalanyl-tRNA--protein transferase
LSSLIWVDPDTPLPEPSRAMPEGLLAAGGDLSVRRLQEAYSKGVFPWFNEGEPVLWWSPDPRMVLPCAHFRESRSLGKKLRQMARQEQAEAADTLPALMVTTDLAFTPVMQACAAARDGRPGTWISDQIVAAYTRWHDLGQVHSVETWVDGKLAGGLYGVCLGRFFFGESMFSWSTDCSKIALAYLVRFLRRHGIEHIDCQQDTRHLSSLGARTMPRDDFLSLLREALPLSSPPWQAGRLLHDGRLVRLGGQHSSEETA